MSQLLPSSAQISLAQPELGLWHTGRTLLSSLAQPEPGHVKPNAFLAHYVFSLETFNTTLICYGHGIYHGNLIS